MIYLFLIFFSVNSFAGEWILGAQPADEIEIAGEQMGYPKGLYFVNEAGYENPDKCPSNQFIQITEDFLIDRALSAAMYAQASGRKMKFYVSGCSGNYMKGHAFQLVD